MNCIQTRAPKEFVVTMITVIDYYFQSSCKFLYSTNDFRPHTKYITEYWIVSNFDGTFSFIRFLSHLSYFLWYQKIKSRSCTWKKTSWRAEIGQVWSGWLAAGGSWWAALKRPYRSFLARGASVLPWGTPCSPLRSGGFTGSLLSWGTSAPSYLSEPVRWCLFNGDVSQKFIRFICDSITYNFKSSNLLSWH